MATRGRIGIELSDGSVLSAYHHWDSYPEWLGRILTTHYNSKELAAELIDGGDMSCAWTDEVFGSDQKTQYGANYYSYRGENCPPRLDKDLNEYLCNSEEYSYIFTKEGEWVCYTDDHRFPGVVKKVEIPNGALAV